MELTILAVCKGIGIRADNAPDVQTLSELADFVLRYWSDVTPAEFKESIDRLIVDGVEHYGTLNKSFIAKAMNGWKERKVVRSEPMLMIEQQINRTPEQAYARLIDYWVKHGELPIIWDWQKVYDYMNESNMIDASIYTDAHKETLSMKIVAQQKAELVLKSNKSASEIVIRKLLEALTINSYQVKQLLIKEIVSQIFIQKYESKTQASVDAKTPNAK
jgi:hypothetical protein